MELMHGECPVARSKANRRGGHLCPGVQQDRATQEVITEAEGMAKGAVREICSEMADLPKLIKSDRAAEVGGTDKATVRRACCEMADLPRRNKSECPAAAHGVNQGFQETADLPKLAEFERAAALEHTGAPARVWRAMDGGRHRGAMLPTRRTVGGHVRTRVAQDEEVS